MRFSFIVAQSFLRTTEKTDPFYDPIIRVIERMSDAEWKVFVQDRDVECGYPQENVADYRAFERVGVWFYRICRLFAWTVPAWKIYRLFGVLVRPLFARKFAADVIITQAGQFAEEFSGLLPKTRVGDIQHGVIYSLHRGYFDKYARLLPIYQVCSNREFWLYGKGYADCFFKHPDNAKDLQGRVKVIGDVVRAGEKVGVDNWSEGDEVRDVVVFSLQLTADLSQEEIAGSVARMEAFFADFFAKYGDKYKCFMKHHPRFNNVYDLSALYAKFPQVTETREAWTELYSRTVLHVTFNSTVTFDCASQGVPTCLLALPDAKILNCDFFLFDYDYPYFGKSASELLGIPLEEARKTMIEWHRRFYAPFDEGNSLRLLYGDSNSINNSKKE